MTDCEKWTTETLAKHLVIQIEGVKELMRANDKRYTERFEAQERAVANATASADRALTKAETASEKRFDNTNEWRQAMNDRDRLLVSRNEVQVLVDSLNDKVNGVCERMKSIEGQVAGRSQMVGWLVAIVIVVLAAMMRTFKL